MESSGPKPQGIEKNLRIHNMLASIERTFLPIGSEIGKYRIIDEIDRGGMAVVYKALQLDLDREVALKVMPANISINRGFVERFLTEAHAVARLSHPNIVSIHEVARENNIYYLAMDYIPGKNLYYYLHYTKPKLVDVLEIVSKLADALAYAHEQKIIHRDLKLNNVIMKDRLNPVLIDFGLAKAMENDAPEHPITRTGEIMGSPSYMAPERLLGGIVDHRSDVCSLGIMLYEMLTFKNPYLDQRNLHQTTINVMEANPIAPRKLVPWLPPEIEAITLKAMAKDLSVRYQTMGDFKADINRYQRGEPVLAQPPSLWTKIKKYSNRHWPTIVISLLVSLFTAVFVFLIYNQSRKEQSHWRSAFECDFENIASISDWDFSNDSEWVFKGGALAGRSNSVSYAKLKRRINRDLKIECDISADTDDLFNAGVFVYGDKPDSGYCIHLNKGAQALHGVTFPGSSMLFYDAEPAKVPLTKKNHLVIEREHNCLVVQVNGVTIAQVWDVFPSIGQNHDQIGFFVNNSSARFDNLKIVRMAIPQIPGPGTSADRFRECGNFEAAINEYNELLLDFPTAPFRGDIELKLADCLIRTNRFDEAVNLLASSDAVNRNDNANARVLLLLSILNNKAGVLKVSDSLIAKLSRKFPDSPENLSAMTYALIKCDSFLQQGQALTAQNEIRSLMGHYRFYPRRWGKAYLQVLDYYVKNNDLIQSQTVSEEILAAFPAEPEIDVRATIAKGNVLLDLGKKEMARDVFDRCTAMYLNTDGVWDAWLKLAEIYEYDNRIQDARRIYQKVSNECSGSVPQAWMAAIKCGELESRFFSADSSSYFEKVEKSDHPFPQCRLIANYYLDRINDNEFTTRWLSLFPDDKNYLYCGALKALMKSNKTVAKKYLLEFKNRLNKKSWRYFQVTKILSNLS